jgi:hypothetical protein
MSPETHPEAALAFYREQLAPGSHLVLTHGSEDYGDKGYQAAAAAYAKSTNPIWLRPGAEFATFFGDWELVEPGICWVVQWRPDGTEDNWWDNDPQRSAYLAGVAIRPDSEA